MKKYPIKEFYLGRINFSFPYESLLIPKKTSQEQREKRGLVHDTIYTGAINLSDKVLGDNINIGKRILYKPVYTIFHKEPDNSYCCLHNWFSYEESSEIDPLEGLIPLTACLPKIASNIDDEISLSQAIKIFSVLFKKTNSGIIYTDQTFLLDDFYVGDALLYTSEYTYNGISRDMNLAKHLIISNNGLTTCSGGLQLDEDQNLFTYISYPTILLQVGKNKLYNVLDNQMYNNNGTCQDSSRCYVNKDVRMSLGLEIPQRVIYNNRISIPEVIKLTKRRKP